ncbi:MAG TPA: fumarate reductase/succinate dehydrogenase flavoprotein subunit [Kribbellaceae bacterium]|nr:fumarate reductase/succinate dehydrogenase flavoprotein subunit [Kribbellaceae bacterium]
MISEVERYAFDVVVIGAGGAGLQAAISARLRGKRTVVLAKAPLSTAHTARAEGGVAASLGHGGPGDGWESHFRDTLRGGAYLGDWRMAELLAREAPDRVRELEAWGARFDRDTDGRISQRTYGGHEHARLAHTGDHTGRELMRTLWEKAAVLEAEGGLSTAGATVTRLLRDGGRICGAFARVQETGRFTVFEAPAVVLATGGVGGAYKVTTNTPEATGDGHALALLAGASLRDMEFVQFHPTGMVWPPPVRGVLVAESVRSKGAVLLNSRGERFMFGHVPAAWADRYADTPDEADRWYGDPACARRPPEMLLRDQVARAVNVEVKAGRGSPHGGVYLSVVGRMPGGAAEVRRVMPALCAQFAELAGVDITTEPMEVGPTCHYVMGGVAVDPDTGAATVPGLFAAGECAGGLHGANRLGGNSLADLLVFGRRAGLGACAYVDGLGGSRPVTDSAEVGRAAEEAAGREGGGREGGEAPQKVHADLQQTMHDLVGIVRTEAELRQAIKDLGALRRRARRVSVGAPGSDPSWRLAMDLRNMLLVSEAIARSALERAESRGGHIRDDHPAASRAWQALYLTSRLARPAGQVEVGRRPVPPVPARLAKLFRS